MQIPQWINPHMYKEKKFWVVSAIVLMSILLVYLIFIKDPGRPSQGVLEKAISKTRDARNFRYRVETRTNINGKKNTFSTVEGEKFRPDNLHLKGQVMKTAIDIYQINEKIYAKDNFGGKWVTVDINELNQDGNFMNELNPLENFSFKELGEVDYKGLVKSTQGKCWEYVVHPVVDNTYMEALWSDFTYHIWVYPGQEKVSRAQISAKGKENDKDEIVVTIDFYDYNDVKPINPPI